MGRLLVSGDVPEVSEERTATVRHEVVVVGVDMTLGQWANAVGMALLGTLVVLVCTALLVGLSGFAVYAAWSGLYAIAEQRAEQRAAP